LQRVGEDGEALTRTTEDMTGSRPMRQYSQMGKERGEEGIRNERERCRRQFLNNSEPRHQTRKKKEKVVSK